MAKGITLMYGGLGEQATTEIDAFLNTILRYLQYVGEMAIAYARGDHPNNWKDVTGNLRSSIGYVVLQDGRPVAENRPSGAGEALLEKLRSQFTKGFALIVCAGMLYASYVESRGRDVLTGAELLAERLVNELAEQMRKRWGRRCI